MSCTSSRQAPCLWIDLLSHINRPCCKLIPGLKASTDESPYVAIHLPAKLGGRQVMDFGTAEGEHTSKVPERIPADTFQQLAWQDTECSAVNRLTLTSTRLCLAFGNWKLQTKNFCLIYAFTRFPSLPIPITAITLHYSFLVKGYKLSYTHTHPLPKVGI